MKRDINSGRRIGVYICHCGQNITSTLDVIRPREAATEMAPVVVVRDYKFMCPAMVLLLHKCLECVMSHLEIKIKG